MISIYLFSCCKGEKRKCRHVEFAMNQKNRAKKIARVIIFVNRSQTSSKIIHSTAIQFDAQDPSFLNASLHVHAISNSSVVLIILEYLFHGVPDILFPPNISHLTFPKFGDGFNQVIASGVLPQNLSQLTFGHNLNQLIASGVLPPNVSHLTFG